MTMQLLDDPSDWVRLVNLLLCIVILALACAPTSVRWWRREAYEVRMAYLALGLMVAATGVGTVQAVLEDSPGGVHVLTYTAGLLIACVAVTTLHIRQRRRRRGHQEHPHD